MFGGEVDIHRKPLTPDEVKNLIGEGVESCCNPSHQATINAMAERFGMVVNIPTTPPTVSLHSGDSVIIMGVRGLPRLTDRHEYTPEEISSATFSFSIYSVS